MVLETASPNINKKTSEVLFDIADGLCKRYMGLDPFEIYNKYYDEVLDLYVKCVIADTKAKQNKNEENVEWVTSKNATWH